MKQVSTDKTSAKCLAWLSEVAAFYKDAEPGKELSPDSLAALKTLSTIFLGLNHLKKNINNSDLQRVLSRALYLLQKDSPGDIKEASDTILIFSKILGITFDQISYLLPGTTQNTVDRAVVDKALPELANMNKILSLLVLQKSMVKLHLTAEGALEQYIHLATHPDTSDAVKEKVLKTLLKAVGVLDNDDKLILTLDKTGSVEVTESRIEEILEILSKTKKES